MHSFCTPSALFFVASDALLALIGRDSTMTSLVFLQEKRLALMKKTMGRDFKLDQSKQKNSGGCFKCSFNDKIHFNVDQDLNVSKNNVIILIDSLATMTRRLRMITLAEITMMTTMMTFTL